MLFNGVELQPGDLIIEKDNGVWGALTRVFAGRAYQHARIVDFCAEYVWEGVFPFVSRRAIDPKKAARYEVWRPKYCPAVKASIVRNVAKHDREPYGVLELGRFVLATRFGLVTPDAPYSSCSELIARAGEDAQAPLSEKPASQSGPWDLRCPRYSEQLC